MLYDGAVTLDENGEGELTLDASFEVDKAYSIVINSHTYVGTAVENQGIVGILYGDQVSGFRIYGENPTIISCTSGIAGAGENTLKITEASFAVVPDLVSISVNNVAEMNVVGEVASYESSDENVAVVLTEGGLYGIKGVGTGNCAITFHGIGGEVSTVYVRVIRAS